MRPRPPMPLRKRRMLPGSGTAVSTVIAERAVSLGADGFETVVLPTFSVIVMLTSHSFERVGLNTNCWSSSLAFPAVVLV